MYKKRFTPDDLDALVVNGRRCSRYIKDQSPGLTVKLAIYSNSYQIIALREVIGNIEKKIEFLESCSVSDDSHQILVLLETIEDIKGKVNDIAIALDDDLLELKRIQLRIKE